MKRSYCSYALTLVLLTAISFAAMAGNTGSADQALKNAKTKSYIVLMEHDPVVRYDGGIDGLAATKPGKGGKINPNSAHVRKYQKFLERAQLESLADAGVDQSAVTNTYTIALNGYSAILTPSEADAIKAQAGVVRVIEDVMRYPTTDASPAFLGLDVDGGAWDKGYDGDGVVVGVIDSGIWPEHPSFADDGSFDPLSDYAGLPCEFGNTAHNPDDAPFTCNNKLLGARQMLATYRWFNGADPDEFDSARDDDGHGTHTASTAAGNAGVEASVLGVARGVVTGMAPRARVIAYKGLGNLGGYTSDLAAAIDQAVADGVDVINYSVGGGASLSGADDIAYLFAADAGVFVATSNGNSGPGAGTVGGPASVPWLTSVGASTQSRGFVGSAASSDGWEFFGASITYGTSELPLVDAADAGDPLCAPGNLDGSVAGKIVLCQRGVYDRVAKSLAVFMAGGEGMILFNTDDGQSENADTHWVPTVHVNNTDGLVIKGYIAASGSPVAQINGGEKVYEDAPYMAGFSSRGPNTVALDIIKPDITAPGVNILAGHSPFPDEGSVPGELFQAIGGTSMSSPHIAGIFALIKQAHPDWTPAIAKSALMTTAYQDVLKEDGFTPADPFDFGAGHLNVAGPVNKGSAFEPGLAYDAGFLDYLGFLCDADPSAFANPAGTCAFLESLGIPTESSNLNLPSIGIYGVAGSQTVQRTVTSVAKEQSARTYSVSVDAPAGFEVTVSPATIRLRSGESATYWVTVTNVSAPAGEWRHGSLTWVDATGNYAVRSPISVNAALFAAPPLVQDTGESGSASFDIGFGYSGTYSAAAHGLEPATVTSDNVLQDPDQTFDPNDGFSNLHQFNLSGAAYFRIALPPEGTEADADLDVFVYNPSGVQVASSTSGGTDELVEIMLPEDGTWSVYVHGWSAPGGDSDYDLYSWAVSATPGGNLNIDSAPVSATIGTTESIDISWSGATAGQWHFGAVSHTGDAGLMALTLIEVDNR